LPTLLSFLYFLSGLRATSTD